MRCPWPRTPIVTVRHTCPSPRAPVPRDTIHPTQAFLPVKENLTGTGASIDFVPLVIRASRPESASPGRGQPLHCIAENGPTAGREDPCCHGEHLTGAAGGWDSKRPPVILSVAKDLGMGAPVSDGQQRARRDACRAVCGCEQRGVP